jgi:integrase
MALLRQPKKSSRQLRRVPPAPARPGRSRCASAPSGHTPLLFLAARGGYIELGKWRSRDWKPALIAAGIDHRRIYDCRHTYATWSLAAGVSLFALSRRMGISLAMIDATYGHLALDA